MRGESPEVVYDPLDYPGTKRALACVLVLPWNESYTAYHVTSIATAIRQAVRDLVRMPSVSLTGNGNHKDLVA